MRWLWMQILKPWKILSFADKVALIAAFIGFLVIALSMSFAAVAYRADKEAYLYEMQILRARTAALKMQTIMALARNQATHIAPGDQLPAAASIGLIRLPEKGESFVAVNHKKEFFYRTDNGSLISVPLEIDKINADDGTVFFVTSDGTVVASSDLRLLKSGNNVFSRPAVTLALQSGLTESTLAIENGERPLVVAFTEVPGTNLLVFAELPTERLMSPFYEAMGIWLIFAFVTVGLGACLAFFAVKRIAMPARLAAEQLLNIAKGQYLSGTQYVNNDEFKIVFKGIDYLAQNIALREERLHLVGDGLRSILHETAALIEPLQFNELSHRYASLLKSILWKYNPTFYGVQNHEQTILFNAQTLAVHQESQCPTDNDAVLELPIRPHASKIQLTLFVFGVMPSNIWPETMQTLAQLCEAIASYFDRLAATDARTAQVRQETQMSIAGSIQKSLVVFPATVPGVEIARHYTPAEQVGGDWTSAYFDEKSGVLRFFVADATGHGIAPSLVTAVVAGATRQFETVVMRIIDNQGVGEHNLLPLLAEQLNLIVLDVGADRIGMTMIMGSLNCSTGETFILNMGHPKPILFGNNSKNIQFVPAIARNGPLGEKRLANTQVQQIVLSAGQGILLFTDGLIENYGKRIKTKKLHAMAHELTSAQNAVEKVVEMYTAVAKPNEKAADDVAILALYLKDN